MMRDGVYVSGELWEYWCATFPRPLVRNMWDFVLYDLDNDHAEFVGSLAWQGPRSPV